MSLPSSQPQGRASTEEPPRSRLSAMQSNVRTFLRNPIPSSVYSRSQNASAAPTPLIAQLPTPRMPQLPQFAFLRRQRPADEEQDAVLHQTATASTRRSSTSSQSPLRPTHDPQYLPFNRIPPWQEGAQPMTVALGMPERHDVEEEEEVIMARHPADVPLDPETEELANMVRRKRKRRKGCRRCRRGAWVRKRDGRESLWRGPTRSKCFCCLISGIFLLILLSIYLSLALTKSNLGQELHVLFILAIIGTTIFFAHSLIRLVMATLKPSAPRRQRNRIPSICGPEGFQPDEPIRVHVPAEDDLIENTDVERDVGHVEGEGAANPESKVKAPPPAYGLWRSSVRIQPNLLHWARVDAPIPSNEPSAQSSAASSSRNTPEMRQAECFGANQGIRPPSYASDDGVDYVVSAQPRSTVWMPHLRPPSQLHPALREE